MQHLLIHRIPKAFPRRSQGVPKAFPRRSQGVPKAFPRRSRGVPEAFPRRSRGVPEAFPKRSRGVPEAFPRRSRGVPEAFPRPPAGCSWPGTPWPYIPSTGHLVWAGAPVLQPKGKWTGASSALGMSLLRADRSPALKGTVRHGASGHPPSCHVHLPMRPLWTGQRWQEKLRSPSQQQEEAQSHLTVLGHPHYRCRTPGRMPADSKFHRERWRRREGGPHR
uniref:Uncharacterized protein n=1 Tax=Knipowitschia caucasica TaxID=637954 RepID=A0AAV2K1B5_KNICA